jgi:hypothetical protein
MREATIASRPAITWRAAALAPLLAVPLLVPRPSLAQEAPADSTT